MKNGDSLYKLAEKLWPLNRSLAGSATNKTLIILKKNLPILKIKKIKSGTKVYDWKVPYEWEVKSAKVFDDKKNIIIDYNKNNLHLVTFSKSFAGILNNKSFKKKLFYLKICQMLFLIEHHTIKKIGVFVFPIMITKN